MLAAILEFAVSATFVIVAGTFLARTADRIAELTGLGRLLIGSVLLAGATSLPELSVDVSAVLHGLDDLAVGDLMGSSLMNLAILAVADLLTASRGGMLSRAAAAHAISGGMTIVLTAMAGLMISTSLGLEFVGVGVGSVAVFVVYVLGVRITFYNQRLATEQARGDQAAAEELPTGPAERRAALRRALLTFGGAAVVILVAAPFVARSAGRIAELSGLGHTFVGTTLVALSTALPELVATITSVRIGAFGLAVANIFGSNAFNMAMLLPIDIASEGPLLSRVSSVHVITSFWVVLITAIAIIGQLYHVERRRRLLEPDAALVLALVVAALAMVYWEGAGHA